MSRRAASRKAEAQPEMGSAGGEKLGGGEDSGRGGDTQGRGAGTPCHPLAGAGGARGCR